jgi:hypothetical protein
MHSNHDRKAPVVHGIASELPNAEVELVGDLVSGVGNAIGPPPRRLRMVRFVAEQRAGG